MPPPFGYNHGKKATAINTMRPFTLLIKPACADCNLDCTYCFYAKKAGLYPDSATHRMSDAVLERLVRGYMATTQPQYVFGWQGGEPTLMGLDFFRRVTDLQAACGRPGAIVANGIQTNGTLITDDLAAHLAQYRFLAGVSLDGPPEFHDRYRQSHDGRPTHARVMEGIATLRRHNVEFNILVLVSAANVRHGRQVYRYLKDQGFLHQQYIPCQEFDAQGRPLPFAITGRQWGDFMCAVFDEWIGHDTRKVSVRTFDSILAHWVGEPHTLCHMGTDCCQYFVVEWNGDVYPCDFFVQPDLKLGNIGDTTWEAMQTSPVYQAFGKRKSAWNACCARCRHLPVCAGDCLKHRLATGADASRLSLLCAGWRQFHDHTTSAFRRLAAEVMADRRAAAVDHRRMV
jgi:uncharacterized protein